MMVTIKRPIEGTVPGKLELVNASCVGRHITSERSVVVSRDCAAVHISLLPAPKRSRLPSFWELEALIGHGVEREAALEIMAARRFQPRPMTVPVPMNELPARVLAPL